jgi:hypothetical protein
VKAANTDRTYVLVAANEDERVSWMGALKEQTRRVSVALNAAAGGDAKRPAMQLVGDSNADTAQGRFNRSVQAEEHEDEQLEILSGLVNNLGRQVRHSYHVVLCRCC